MFSSSAAPVKRSAGRRGAKKKVEEEEEKVEELIFSLEAHSSKELRHFKFLCVSFTAQLLGSASFIRKVGDVCDGDAARRSDGGYRLCIDSLIHQLTLISCFRWRTETSRIRLCSSGEFSSVHTS